MHSFKKFLWQWRGVLIAAPSVTALVILLRLTGLLQAWEWGAYDQYMRLRPSEATDKRIAIVGIDEADLREIGQPIIPDAVYADLLEKLKRQQPLGIGLDIYRDLPVEPGHQKLVQIFESTPNLVGIEKVVGDSRRESVAAPPALKAKGQIGANDLIFDADNKVRRGLIYVQGQNGENVYSFSLYLALLYLESKGISPKVLDSQDWQVGKKVLPPFKANDGGYVGADAGGYQILGNYRGSARHFETVSMTDILKNRVPPDWAKNRIILIGAVGDSSNDLFFTPYSSGLLSLPQRIAGVEIHASLASQIISAALDDRPLIQTWTESGEWLWILVWGGVGAILTWRSRNVGTSRFQQLQKFFLPLVAAGMLIGSTYVAFVYGWWIPIIPPLLALGGSAIAITTYIAKTAGDIRKTFGRYLNEEVVANLLETPSGLSLGGERRKITIFTSDLRGFTALSERLPPEEVVKILNFYLGYMADVITQYQGTIDEFMGDGILVLFGAPTAKEDDAERAVACGIAMQLAMTKVNQQMKEWNLPELEMGIGINTGVVVVGNIGSEKRTKYGIVGSQVNLTYRIESYTTGGQILISESTLEAVKSLAKVNGQKQVTPKGVKEPITIYDIGGMGGKYNLSLTKEEEIFFPLTEKIPLHYTILDGKHLSNTKLRGSLVKLSAKGAEVYCHEDENSLPTGLTNIKLNLRFLDSSNAISEDVYAKVLEKTADKVHFYIQFTSKPPDVAHKLDFLYQSLQ